MIESIKKIDIIFVIILFTVVAGIIVITMRSRTYSLGYEIATLKNEEKHLNQKQIELQAELAFTQRIIREKLLEEKSSSSHFKFTLPDQNQVIADQTGMEL